MATLETLAGLVLENIFSRLEPKDVASLTCVSGRLRSSAEDDSIWRLFASRELDLSSPIDPDGNLCPSFKITYGKWRESFSKYPWPLVTRVNKCWTNIKNWMASNFAEARETLRPGAAEDEIEAAEKKLGAKLPLSVRVVYRLVNGQSTFDSDLAEDERVFLLGVIGGYFFYDHQVNVHLLPLSAIVEETKKYRRRLGYSTRSKRIVVAASPMSEKLFFLDCADGKMLVGSKEEETMFPCVPRDTMLDGMLHWLEEHWRRLKSGAIQIREFHKMKMICLFPESSPCCSVAVTNGVKVRASALFIPEMSDLRDEGEDKYWFAYSIRLSLSPEGCTLDGINHSSCQLYSRHWIIRAGENVVSDVRGEAVIGKFPLLFPDKEEFVYESCASLPGAAGSVEGAFTFVPGRMLNPRGRQFDVEVARFPLQVPNYIF